MNLTLTQQARDGVAVVTVAGDVDVYTGHDLRRVLLALSSTGHHQVVVDLTGCTFLDTTGLAAITTAVAQARAAVGDLMIAAAGEQIMKVFRVTGLTRVLPVFGSAADAVTAQRAARAAPPAPG